jgi:hypothetical protein
MANFGNRRWPAGDRPARLPRRCQLAGVASMGRLLSDTAPSSSRSASCHEHPVARRTTMPARQTRSGMRGR